jgi:outer membrane protein OmpA-like peptidoglycan-associated protein
MADTLRARSLGLALAALILAAGDAAAQSVVIGNSLPNVVVDLGVLDSLGPAPTLPALLKGRSTQRVSLRPPSASPPRPAQAARPAPARDEPPKAEAPAPQPIAPTPAPAAAAPPPPAPAPPPVAVAPPPPPAPVAAPPPPPRVAAAPPPAAPPPAAALPPAPRPAAAPPPPAPSPPPTQTAARPPPAAALPPVASAGAGPRLVFGPNSSELPAGADATLRDVAQRLNADEALRLQVVAYADGTPEQASQARRVSLSRALTVRSYLISQGVRSTRIDVRALGSRASDGPPDRVDLLIGDR